MKRNSERIFDYLKAPFRERDICWKVQSSGVTNGTPWVIVNCYVEARAIQNRFDEVFGWENWKQTYREIDGGFICTLSVKIDGHWVSKEDGAGRTDYESLKGGISGAFKRAAASGYGVGRYLYYLEDNFANVSFEEKPGWNKIKAKKDEKTGKEKTPDIYWYPPALPKWALPTGYKEEEFIEEVIPPVEKKKPQETPAPGPINKEVKAEGPPEKPQEGTKEVEKAAPPVEGSVEDLGNLVIHKGKYKGKTVAEVIALDEEAGKIAAGTDYFHYLEGCNKKGNYLDYVPYVEAYNEIMGKKKPKQDQGIIEGFQGVLS